MSKNWNKFVQWLIIWLFVVGVGWSVISSHQTQEQINSYNTVPLIQGNSLLPISTIEFPHTQVLASKITFCESSDRHEGIWGDNGKAYGKWQFHERTFYWLAVIAGYENVNWKNEDDQDLVGMWALEHGYAYLWTCNKLIK